MGALCGCFNRERDTTDSPYYVEYKSKVKHIQYSKFYINISRTKNHSRNLLGHRVVLILKHKQNKKS